MKIDYELHLDYSRSGDYPRKDYKVVNKRYCCNRIADHYDAKWGTIEFGFRAFDTPGLTWETTGWDDNVHEHIEYCPFCGKKIECNLIAIYEETPLYEEVVEKKQIGSEYKLITNKKERIEEITTKLEIKY